MDTGPLHWVGGEHRFRLDLGALRALQEACDAGPEQVLRRIASGAWRVNDLFDTIRLGLIASGEMTEREAAALVSRLFGAHPLIQFRVTAQAILMAALIGVEGDPLGEDKGAPPPPANGGFPSSTATAP